MRRAALISVHTSPLTQPGTGDSGGLNVAVDRLAAHLVADDVEVDVFTRATSGDLPPTVTTQAGYQVHHLPAGPASLDKSDVASRLCSFSLAALRHPAVREADVLHAHYWMSGWVGRQLRRRLGTPLVQSFHTLALTKNAALAPGDAPESPLRTTAERRIVRDADALIAPTVDEQSTLVDAYGADPRIVQLVELGVDLEVFSPRIDRHAARQSLGGGRIVLFVGRLQPLKAPDVAVRALAALDDLLPDDGIPTRLVLVGGASGNGAGATDPPALTGLAAELGVADRVAILAPRPAVELAALYRAADVLIVPSHSESYGLVALEAQACGTPVVAADVAGLRHVLPDGAGGTRVASHAPEAFARALAPYLLDAGRRAQVGSAGVAMASQRTWTRTAERTRQVYAAAQAHTSAQRSRGADLRASCGA